MPANTHTPGPWASRGGWITYDNGQNAVADARQNNNPNVNVANSARIVACANFCAGIPTASLTPEALAGLLAQRDELAASLKAVLGLIDNGILVRDISHPEASVALAGRELLK